MTAFERMERAAERVMEIAMPGLLDLALYVNLANYRDARRRYLDARQRTVLTAEDRAFLVREALRWRERWDALRAVAS